MALWKGLQFNVHCFVTLFVRIHIVFGQSWPLEIKISAAPNYIGLSAPNSHEPSWDYAQSYCQSKYKTSLATIRTRSDQKEIEALIEEMNVKSSNDPQDGTELWVGYANSASNKDRMAWAPCARTGTYDDCTYSPCEATTSYFDTTFHTKGNDYSKNRCGKINRGKDNTLGKWGFNACGSNYGGDNAKDYICNAPDGKYGTDIVCYPTNSPTPSPSPAPSPSPSPSPTPSPTPAPTDNPTKKPTRAPTQQPTFRPTNNPTTPSPTHPGTIFCGEVKTGLYNNALVIFFVQTQFEGDLTFDAQNSDFTITSIKAYNASSNEVGSSIGLDQYLTLSHVPRGDYEYHMLANNGVTGNYDVRIQCSTKNPTKNPTNDPTVDPTFDPTTIPTNSPTMEPTTDPSLEPTSVPTNHPTMEPITNGPTLYPTVNPTVEPTKTPSFNPTIRPSQTPSAVPTQMPTGYPVQTPISTTSSSQAKESGSFNDVLEQYPWLIFAGMGVLAFFICSIAICIIMRKRKQRKEELITIERIASSEYAVQTITNGDTATPENVETMELVKPSSMFSNENTLGVWLKSIGMSEYLELFIKEGFGDGIAPMQALSNLSDEQLKSIGVNKLGHRLIILDSISSLNEGGMKVMNEKQSIVPINDEGKVKGNAVTRTESSEDEYYKETNTKGAIDSSADEDDDMYAKGQKTTDNSTRNSTSL